MQQETSIPNNVFSLDERRRASLDHPQKLTLIPAGAVFQIQVLDDSLTGESILSGDLIDCERTDSVDEGGLGVVQTPYGLMVRRVHHNDSFVRLEAANPSFPALCLSPSEVQVIGRPVRLERWLAGLGESEAA